MPTTSIADVVGLSDNCKSEHLPWSIVATAGPNATLATVLAGFMMSVMAILLSREKGSDFRDPTIAHTLGLFGSGGLILALDAFLFGNISALGPPAKGSNAGCAIAWTEAMPATSMLLVGACLMVAGLAWLMAQYYVSPGLWDAASGQQLDRPTKLILCVPGILTGGVIVTTTPLVFLTVIMYLKIMDTQFDKDVPIRVLQPTLLVILTAYLIAISAIIWHKTRRLVEYIDQEKSKYAEDAVPLNSDFGLLAYTCISAAVLAAVGALFAGLVGEHSPFVDPGTAPGACSIYVGMVLAVAPIAIPAMIALAVPSAPDVWIRGPRTPPAGS